MLPTRKKDPFILIFSLSRCGSTSIHRALNLHRKCNLIYEPDLACEKLEEVPILHNKYRDSYTGMKHVWDPSGFPFRPEHKSNIRDIKENIDKWLSYNIELLNIPKQKIIFLTRHDEKSRIVSDLFGQATDVWGPKASDKHLVKAGQQYFGKVLQAESVSLSVDTLFWYAQNIPILNRKLRESIYRNPVLDLKYEELFSTDIAESQKIWQFSQILDFVELRSNSFNISTKKVANILSPMGKLNNEETYSRIENIDEIRDVFDWKLS